MGRGFLHRFKLVPLSPLISGVFAYLLFYILQRKILYAIDPLEATRKITPVMTFVVFGTFTISLIFNGLDNLDLSLSFPAAILIAILVGALAAAVSFFLIRRMPMALSVSVPPSRNLPQSVVSLEKAMKHLQRVAVSSFDETHTRASELLEEVRALSQTLRKETSFSERASQYKLVEQVFVYFQIASACFVAFAHGANDVANAIGPVAAVLNIIQNGAVSETAIIPSWLLAFGGVGIVLGLATWGWRVIETIGRKITELTPTRGFCAEFGAATTILIASKFGLPISTTHCLVGAVFGVGLARGMQALNLNMLREIILSWVITIPASAISSILVFYLLKWIFILKQSERGLSHSKTLCALRSLGREACGARKSSFALL